ncbi:MAG: methyltransferase [Ktedonobacterales bacterium]
MKLGMVAENPLEWLALASGYLPVPLGHTIVALWMARTLYTATRVGAFEALADGPHTAAEVAARCQTDTQATMRLMNALAGTEYVRPLRPKHTTTVQSQPYSRVARDAKDAVDGAASPCGETRYALTRLARRWLLADSPLSLRDGVLHQALDLRLMDHYETFIRTGEPLNIHETLTPDEWDIYQRGMRSGARLFAPEVAWRTPVPKGPRALLDIGGANGAFALALCRRHPTLHATILDLPQAIEHSRLRLTQELKDAGMEGRICLQAGDARCAELGEGAYDVIFISSLLHHFDDATARELIGRSARALRSGGFLVIQEIMRSESDGDHTGADQLGALADLYFGATSAAGTRSFGTFAAWQRAAGLRPLRPCHFRLAPGTGQQSARKP